MATRKLQVEILGDSSSLQKAFGQAANASSGFGSTLAKVGKAAALAGAAIGAGVGAGLVSSAKAAISFEKEMRNVNSIAKLGDKDFKALGKSVTGMAAEVGQKPKVLAKGLYDIVSSGFKAADAVKVLRVSSKAATAGLTDTATASRAVTAALNAYHQGAGEARKVSDILFQTVNKGVLTFEELSQNMGDLVPAAAPLGVSLEEVGASMATLTLQGVPAAEAATRVKNAMIQLAKPSKGMSALLKENGFASGEAAVKAKGFSGVLELLNKATHGSVSETAKLTPEIRSLLGVVGLTGKNLKVYEENLRAMKQAQEGAGVTAGVFAEQSKSLAVQWQKASAAIDVFKIQIGNALLPALSAGLTAFSGFIQKLSEAKTVRAKLVVVWEGLQGIATTLRTVLANAVSGAIDSVNWDEIGRRIRAGMDKANTAADISHWGQRLGTNVQTALNKLSASIDRADWQKVGAAIAIGLGKAFAAVTIFAASAVPKIALGILKLLVAYFRAGALVAVGAGKAIGEAVVKGIVAGTQGIVAAVRGPLDRMRDAVVGAARAVYGNALAIGKRIVDGIVDGLGGLVGRVGGAILGGLKGAIGWAGGKLTGSGPFEITRHMIGEPMADALVDGFKRRMASAGPKMATSISGAVAAITGEVKKLQGQLDAINARREAEDRASAVRDAIVAVAEARKKGEGVAAAEQALARAREDIVVASTTKRLGIETAHFDKLTALIESRKAKLADAFGNLADFAGRAFAAKTQKMLDKVAAKFDRMIAKVQASGDADTPAEAALKALDRAEAERGRNQDLADANASGDPEAIRRAQLAIQRAALEDQATVERTARDKATAVQITALEATKARELQNLNERRDQLGTKLDEQLGVLQAKLALHPEQYTKNNAAIQKLLASFGINYKTSGENLGKAFARGIDAAQDDVRKAVRRLAQIPDDNWHVKSPTKEGPMSTLDTWWKKLPQTLLSGLDMRPITNAVGSMTPPATATPSAALGAGAATVGMTGGGNVYVTLNAPNYVGDKMQLIELIKREVTLDRKRGGTAFGAPA